jgi:hypothetical protein
LEFANGIEISTSLICAIESARRRVTERLLRLICFSYGANVRWLKTGEGDMFENHEDIRLQRITEDFKKLDTPFQNYILQQMDFVLGIQDKLDSQDRSEDEDTADTQDKPDGE